MSSLLIQERPLMVLPTLATRVGLNEAMFLQQLHYWVDRSNNEFDGRKWVYNTVPEWCAQFPFWSKRTLERILSSLEKQGLIIVGNYNRKGFDRTKWYTVNYEKLEELEAENEIIDTSGKGNEATGTARIAHSTNESEPENGSGGTIPPFCRNEEKQDVRASQKKEGVGGGINPPKWRIEELYGLEGNLALSPVIPDGMTPPDCRVPSCQNDGMDSAFLAEPIPENNNKKLPQKVTTTGNSQVPMEESPKPGMVEMMLLSAASYGLSETTLRKYLRDYGETLVLKEFSLLKKLMDEKKPIKNPGGWLCRALEEQYEDAQANYEKIRQERKVAAEARQKQLLEQYAREDEEKRKAEHVEIAPSNPLYTYLHRHSKRDGDTRS